MENNSGSTNQNPLLEVYEWQRQHYPEIYNLGKKQ